MPDNAIDYLVGHHPQTRRGRHFVRPSWDALRAAIDRIPALDLRREQAADNVVEFTGAR